VIPARVWASSFLTGITPQWWDYNIPPRQADLYQAKLLPIAMEAVGFRIDSYAIDRRDFLE